MLERFLWMMENRSKVSPVVIGILLAAFIGWIDYVTGDEISIALFYLIPVIVTAWFAGRWAGAGVSMQCAAEGFFAGRFDPAFYSHAAIPYWNAAMMLGFYAAVTFLLVALHDSLRREVALAHKIQTNLLPGTLDLSPATEIAAAWKPSVSIGGDYYDVFALSRDRLGFCIADVSGHGMPAALLMSNVQSAVRLLAGECSSPRDLCVRLNHQTAATFPDGTFLTFLFAVLDVPSARLIYSNAGHNPPMIVHRSGAVTALQPGGIPLGIIQSWVYHDEEVSLEPGDMVFLYTDGVTEARNFTGELFGEDRLLQVLRRNHSHGPEGIKEAVLQAVRTFSKGDLEDDVTLLCIMLRGVNNEAYPWRRDDKLAVRQRGVQEAKRQ